MRRVVAHRLDGQQPSGPVVGRSASETSATGARRSLVAPSDRPAQRALTSEFVALRSRRLGGSRERSPSIAIVRRAWTPSVAFRIAQHSRAHGRGSPRTALFACAVCCARSVASISGGKRPRASSSPSSTSLIAPSWNERHRRPLVRARLRTVIISLMATARRGSGDRQFAGAGAVRFKSRPCTDRPVVALSGWRRGLSARGPIRRRS
jgi:hypothetical protein